MPMVVILYVDQNLMFVLGLGSNIYTVVGIVHSGCCYGWKIYEKLIVIDLHIGNKFSVVEVAGVKLIAWLFIQIPALFHLVFALHKM